MVYTTYNGIFFSLKRGGKKKKEEETLSHATVEMKIEDIMLRKISQPQKDKYCMIPLS